MNTKIVLLGFLGVVTAGFAVAAEGPVPSAAQPLNHVFVIMMENHGYSQVVGNPSLPFTNSLMSLANISTNYFAVAHPSLTNYLEVVGGSNFGIHTDNYPDWHNMYCSPNLAYRGDRQDRQSSATGIICPISGIGTDAATLPLTPPTRLPASLATINIDGIQSIAAASQRRGQDYRRSASLSVGGTWKSYQESLPPQGADGVNISDGFFSNT